MTTHMKTNTNTNTKPLPDYFKQVLGILQRRFKKQGYLTEKDKGLLLKTFSWLVGSPVTEYHLKELERYWDAREKAG